MRSANILIAGMKGTNAEVCKNLVLAGVNVTLQDSEVVDIKDLAAQFFIKEDDVGKNVRMKTTCILVESSCGMFWSCLRVIDEWCCFVIES